MKQILNGMKLITGSVIIAIVLIAGYLIGYDDRIAAHAVQSAQAAEETARERAADLEASINTLRDNIADVIAAD